MVFRSLLTERFFRRTCLNEMRSFSSDSLELNVIVLNDLIELHLSSIVGFGLLDIIMFLLNSLKALDLVLIHRE